MLHLREACCCYTLRTGNLILGWVQVVFGTIGTIVAAFFKREINRHWGADWGVNDYHYSQVDLNILLVLSLAVCSIGSLLGICHLYGTYKHRRGFLMPYLSIGSIQLCLVAIVVLKTIQTPRIEIFAGPLTIFVIFVYFYRIAWIFYNKELGDQTSFKAHHRHVDM